MYPTNSSSTPEFSHSKLLKETSPKELGYLEVRFSPLNVSSKLYRTHLQLRGQYAEIKRYMKTNLPERGISPRRAVACEEEEPARLQKRGLHEMEKTEDRGDGTDKP